MPAPRLAGTSFADLVLTMSIMKRGSGPDVAFRNADLVEKRNEPVLRHRVPANGINLQVLELGAGPPVLFCHGFPAIAVSWEAQIRAVADAGYRALAPDMRGYGDSDAPAEAEAYTPFQTVGDLVGLLDHFALPDCVVVGHDFGANVAWNAAMMRPDRFRAVFGISVAFQQPGGPSFLDKLRAAGRDDFYMFDQMRPEADTAWADAAETLPAMYYWSSGQAPSGRQWDPFDWAGMRRPAPEPLRAVPSAYMEKAIAAFTRTGFHAPLNYYRAIDAFFAAASRAYAGARIHQPSYFLTGAEDGLRSFIPDEDAMRASLPGLRGVTTLEGVGHWPQLEGPEAVASALLAFLEQTSA